MINSSNEWYYFRSFLKIPNNCFTLLAIVNRHLTKTVKDQIDKEINLNKIKFFINSRKNQYYEDLRQKHGKYPLQNGSAV